MPETGGRKAAEQVVEAASSSDPGQSVEGSVPSTSDEGDRTQRGRAAGKRVKIVPPSRDLRDSYADGALGVHVRDTVLKLDLYCEVGVDQESGAELRTISHRLVLPITAIGGLIQLLQSAVQQMQKDGRLTIQRADTDNRADVEPENGS